MTEGIPHRPSIEDLTKLKSYLQEFLAIHDSITAQVKSAIDPSPLWDNTMMQKQQIIEWLGTLSQYIATEAPSTRNATAHGINSLLPTRTAIRTPESMLVWVQSWIPPKYRGEALQDLQEDIQSLRRAGFTDWRIRRRIFWQLGWLVLANVRIWLSDTAGWVIGKFRSQ